MNLTDLKVALPILIKSKLVPLVIGETGTGKTHVCSKVGRALGFDRVVNLRVALSTDAGDITGLPNFELVEGEERTSFRPPVFLPNKNEKVLIILDEINRIQNRQILNALFQMIELDDQGVRRLGQYTFPEGTSIIALANPPTKRFTGVIDFKDEAFKSRFVHISFAPTDAEFLAYISNEGGFSKSIVNFLSKSENSSFIHSHKNDFVIDYMEPNHRSWEYLDRIEKLSPPDHILMELGVGIVGSVATLALMEDKKNNKQKMPITLQSVLENTLTSTDIEERLAFPELLDVTLTALTQEATKRSETKTLFTETEVKGMAKLLIEGNPEQTLKFLNETAGQESFNLTQELLMKHIYTNHKLTVLVFKSKGVIKDGEEDLLIGLHERVEIVDETGTI